MVGEAIQEKEQLVVVENSLVQYTSYITFVDTFARKLKISRQNYVKKKP